MIAVDAISSGPADGKTRAGHFNPRKSSTMNTQANFKQTDVKRAIKAVVDAGFLVDSVEIRNDGTIRVLLNSEKSVVKGPEPEL